MINKDQKDAGLPIYNKEKRHTSNLLPYIFRSEDNKKILNATLDQLTQPGTVKKVNGFVGRKYAKSSTADDIFLQATDNDRQSYQLEPSVVIDDYLGNTTFYKDYIDHINHIRVLGGNVDDHNRLNQQQSYSWEPHISWDKFVNSQNYYWLPNGPKPITVYGQQKGIKSEYEVRLVNDGDNYSYIFGTDAEVRNPEIILYRGQTYIFKILSPNNPFSIKTSRTTDSIDYYSETRLIEDGVIELRVNNRTPDTLYYISENDYSLGGIIKIFDVTENTFLDVDSSIIGKTSYTLVSGLALSNGMKLQFRGNVTPKKYETDYWYVEGVGDSIKLIPESALYVYRDKKSIEKLPFDTTPFDTEPFDGYISSDINKEYVVINRASMDGNYWSRMNKWFHKDVILASADENNTEAFLDQNQRAKRPIIEFNPNLKLFNFGDVAKYDVDLIDLYTKDVFSVIEGSIGYSVDGVPLSSGMRVLFAADTDSMVRGKIYDVNFIEVNIPGRRIQFNGDDLVLSDNTIHFTVPHTMRTGTPVIYINDGNPDIIGLNHRSIYYVRIITSTSIKLCNSLQDALSDSNDVVVDFISDGIGVHVFELYLGKRRQLSLTESFDSTPNHNETVMVRYGSKHGGGIFWFNGENWILGQSKDTTPLFDVFDAKQNSYSTYESSSFLGTKLFSYKLGNSIVDTELGFPLSYRNISNIGDITFEFNLLNDTFGYLNNDEIVMEKFNTGFLKKIKSLSNYDFVNGYVKSKKINQHVVRTYTNQKNNFFIDVYDDVHLINDIMVKLYQNGKYVEPSQYTIETVSNKKVVTLIKDVELSDIITIKTYSHAVKNENGFYEIPACFQNNPLNDDIVEFTLGQVIDHVSSIIENDIRFVGDFPGTGNLRDLSNLSSYGTRFVQHSGPLVMSLYHLGDKSANVHSSLMAARDDYGKFKRAFITLAGELGIDAEPKQMVDHILGLMTSNKPTRSRYYLSDMFAFSGSVRHEYVVLDSRTTSYPLVKEFSMTELSNQSVLVYLNNTQLVYGFDYLFNNDFVTIKTTLAENDLIEIYEYESTDGTCCPPTPTKLGLYPKFKPMKYLDTSYVEPVVVIQGHDGSITIAYDDYRDDLILELETRIFNNIKIEYDSEIFDIFDLIPGYNRPTAYTKTEVDKIMGPSFYQWTNFINQDYTKMMGYDRSNPFTFNYRENYAPDGTGVPAYWRGIYQWMFDTTRPHITPWEMLGYSLEPHWWTNVYGPAPYTSENLLLWDDLKNGIIREPDKAIVVIDKFKRPVLEYVIPVDEYGNLIDPIASNAANGYIKSTESGFFVFGDIGPVESSWRNSSYYPFSLLMASLLMNPNMVLGVYYDRSRIVKNLANQYVYSETNLRITPRDLVLPTVTSSNNRTFTSGLVNYVVDHISSDVTARLDNYQSDLKSLTVCLASKLGGFTSKEKINILLDSKTPSSTVGVFVPDENYDIFLNTSSPIKKLVYSGIIITRYSDGFEVSGYSIDDPYFNVNPFIETDRVIRVGGISENFTIWEPNTYYIAGKLVGQNNNYYRVSVTHNSGNNFDLQYYVRLAELPIYGGVEAIVRKSHNHNVVEVVNYGTKFSTIQEICDFIQGYGSYLESNGFVFDEYNSSSQSIQNWITAMKEFMFWTSQTWPIGSSISLSPGASKLMIRSSFSIVDNIIDTRYRYQFFDQHHKKIDLHSIKTYRNDNDFVMSNFDSELGIYGATLYLIQKEHVMRLDNKTIFNDVIYDLVPGYRQDKLKMIGYITQTWTGGFNIPGFVYDQAVVAEWQPWVDYHLGDIVKHKEFYYSANKFIQGSELFVSGQWNILESRPHSQLIPNWDYRSEQFTDFYDLDSDNFDSEQQRMAQHLIGYQKRQYLENIIKDEVSQYKFYQGMIIEKGTTNVLNKLFDVLSSTNKDSLVFNEEWAVRVGNYGGTHIFDEFEIKLSEDKFKLSPQPVMLVNDIDQTLNPLVYQIKKSEMYVRPRESDAQFKLTNQSSYLRSAGYVRYDDVDIVLRDLSDIVNTKQSLISEGSYIWCAFEKDSWEVYQYIKVDVEVDYSGAGSQDGIVSVVFSEPLYEINPPHQSDYRICGHVGIMAMNGIDVIDVIGKIVEADENSFKVYIDGVKSNDVLSDCVVYVFLSRRYKTLPNYDASIPTIYVDDYLDTEQWAVLTIQNDEWSVIRNGIHRPNPNNIKKAFVYNNDSIIRYLDIVDPYFGKIPGIADQEIKYKTYYDPAIYSIGSELVNIDSGLNWMSDQVGTLWWDLTNAKFMVNNDSDIVYNSLVWNQLHKYASIDLFEWVESEYLPSEWDEISDSERGLVLGISGTSLYGDECYSVKQHYDNITNTYINTYYYWVKNKDITPNKEGRKLTSKAIASLITSPREYGYKCVGLLSSNALNLVNFEHDLNKENTILSMQYWIVDDHNLNSHSQWKILSEHTNTKIPKNIENKWIDSLVGFDSQQRQVPNYQISEKLRYGIETKPRQSMFINRIEALKQYVERVNLVLSTASIVDNTNISKLYEYDKPPSKISGMWDHQVDSYDELRFIGTYKISKAELSPVVNDGKIVSIIIVNPGYGYTNGPSLHTSIGSGVDLSVVLNEHGSIVDVIVNQSGVGYTDESEIVVRPFSVLVNSVSTLNGIWAIYTYNNINGWELLSKQQYNVTKYWSYKDWYDIGYSQYTKVDYIVPMVSDLYVLEAPVGSIIKVENVGVGGWILLRKVTDDIMVDYTLSYDIVARQNGTIQLSEKLYTYDNTVYVPTIDQPDPYAIVTKSELYIILVAIRDDIFVEELYSNYLKLFFASIRYALSEQLYCDWVMKTSFVKVTHNVGELKQKVTFNNDNLSDFENYVSEVKPYRTKIREYISVYDSNDISNTVISDFDLPTIVNYDKNYENVYAWVDKYGTIKTDNPYIDHYPWKNWYDAVGFNISEIKLVDPGEGYLTVPKIRIIGGFGSGASAIAYLNNGQISNIKLISGGSGYLSTPIIQFDGGVVSGGHTAKAMAIIKSEVVRSTSVFMKFDRISNNMIVGDRATVETFEGNGRRRQFKLKFQPTTLPNDIVVLIDDIELLPSEYELSNGSVFLNGHTQYFGILTLTKPAEVNSVININYVKDLRYLTASERVSEFYKPGVNQYGPYMNQLSGYDTFVLSGAGFKYANGWDSLSWDSDLWDQYQDNMDFVNMSVLYGTEFVRLPFIPNAGETYSLWMNGAKIDDYSFVGDGENSLIPLSLDWYEELPPAKNPTSTIYTDRNMIITSGILLINNGVDTIIDQMSSLIFKSVKYQIQCLTNTVNHVVELSVINNNETVHVSIINGSLNGRYNYMNSPDSSVSNVLELIGDDSSIFGHVRVEVIDHQMMIYFMPNLSDVNIMFDKHAYTTGEQLNLTTDGIEDTTFEYMSDYMVYDSTSEISQNIVMDEFDISDFSSARYYIQVYDSINTHILEVSVLHNAEEVISEITFENKTTTLIDISASIVDNNVTVSYSTLSNGIIHLVFSRMCLSSGNNRLITGLSPKRISDGTFAISTFEHETTNLKSVVVDRFDILMASSVFYQIQLTSKNRTQLITLAAFVSPFDVGFIKYSESTALSGECGYFTGSVVSGKFELLFTPTTDKVYVVSVKTLLVSMVTTIIANDINYRQMISTNSLPSISQVVVDSFDLDIRSVKYNIQLSGPTGYHSCIITLTHDMVESYLVQYSDVELGILDGVFETTIDNNRVLLKYKPNQPNTDIVMLKTMISDQNLNYNPDLPSYIFDSNVGVITSSKGLTLASEILDQFSASLYASVRYSIQMVTTSGEVQFSEINLVQNGIVVDFTDYAINNTQELGSFSATLSNNVVTLKFDKSTTDTIQVKMVKTVISRYNNLTTLENSVDQVKNRNVFLDSGFYVSNTLGRIKIDSFGVNEYNSGSYQIQLVSDTNVNIVDLFLNQNGLIVDWTTYAIIDIGTTCGDFVCELANDMVDVYFVPFIENVRVTYYKMLVNGDIVSRDISGLDLVLNMPRMVELLVVNDSSDGSINSAPFEQGVGLYDYDTIIECGDFNSQSIEVGFRPEDIVIAGGELNGVTNFDGPEELYTSQISDTLSIKVFQLPEGGAPIIKYDRYVATSSHDYKYSQPILDTASLIVKKNDTIVTDYSIDLVNRIVTISDVVIGDIVTLITFGITSMTLLDNNVVVIENDTKEVITHSPWLDSQVSSLVLVNGNVKNYELFRTNDNHTRADLVGIRFGQELMSGDQIMYMIEKRTTSAATNVVQAQQIIIDGSTDYQLSNITESDFGNNVIVRKGDTIFSPGKSLYFRMEDGNRTFIIPIIDAYVFSLDYSNFTVIINGILQTPMRDYTFDESTNTFKFIRYYDNELINIMVDQNTDYAIKDGKISFNDGLGLIDGDIIDVLSFYSYSHIDVERTTDHFNLAPNFNMSEISNHKYIGKLSGIFILNEPAVSDDYVWVIKNGKQLTKAIDYVLYDDQITVRLSSAPLVTDIIQIISFGNKLTTGSYGYMQFKDNLDRTHYKRLNAAKSTYIVSDLFYKDTEIRVADASVLDEPDPSEMLHRKPGIIEINGERIEYFEKDGNILRQLRRGTLGTGTPDIHRSGLLVLNLGPSETIPYHDSEVVSKFRTKRTTTLIPISHKTKNRNNNSEYGITDELSVVVGGSVLNKDMTKVYDDTSGINNEEFEIPPEFTVNGNNYVKLTNPAPKGLDVIVIKKQLKLLEENNYAMNFIKSVETIWPQNLVDKYQYVLKTDSNITLETDDSEIVELD